MADSRTLEDRARVALIREWAKDNGLEVGAKGRLPAGIVAAYEAATGTALDPGPEDEAPDWDEALSAETADPLAALEDQLGAGGGESPGEAAPPPPADLEEARARLGSQPKTPKWAKDKPRKDPGPPVKVTKPVIGDIEGKLALLLTPPVAFWQMAVVGSHGPSPVAAAPSWPPLQVWKVLGSE